jgi:hypothetical protein
MNDQIKRKAEELVSGIKAEIESQPNINVFESIFRRVDVKYILSN